MDSAHASLSEMIAIDLDWSFPIMISLVLIVMVVLNKLIFQPYLAGLEKREQKTDETRSSAKSLREKAEAQASTYRAQVGDARVQGAEARQKLRTEGLAHKEEVVGTARSEAAAKLDAARADVEAQAESVRAELLTQVDELSRLAAEKVLGRGV